MARGGQVGNYLPFYLHDVVLRSIGWHLSWWLEWRTSEDWATLIVAGALAILLGVIMARRPGTRPFIVTALLTGVVFTEVSVFLTPWAAPVTFRNEAEAAPRLPGIKHRRDQRRGTYRVHEDRLRPPSVLTPALAVRWVPWRGPGSDGFPAPPVVVLAGDRLTVTCQTRIAVVGLAAEFAGLVAFSAVG